MKLDKIKFLKIFVLIFGIILLWFGLNKNNSQNCFMAFFQVFPDVFFYFFAYFLGLIYILSMGENNKALCEFINIRGKGKLKKVKDYFLESIYRGVLYFVCFIVCVFFAALVFNGLGCDTGYEELEGLMSYYPSLIYNKISMGLGIFLCCFRLLLHTILIACLYVFLEILIKQYKFFAVFAIILLSCLIDYRGIPVLSLWSYGVDYDFLYCDSNKAMIIAFITKNIYLLAMSGIYYVISILTSDKIDLTRV